MTNLFAIIQHFGHGWSLHVNRLDITRTNVDFAASQLLEFYSQVAAAALPVWSQLPAATARGATLGEVSIHFRSAAPIPGEVLQGWLVGAVGQMRTTPGNTVVAGYRVALVSGVVQTAPIWVELILPWVGAAAAA
ncbi:MAG: hypothetical protein Q9216_006973 [Gyalolechia sp. 2 TL-2023]